MDELISPNETSASESSTGCWFTSAISIIRIDSSDGDTWAASPIDVQGALQAE